MNTSSLRTLITTAVIALLTFGCAGFPNWPGVPDNNYQATLIYRSLEGNRRIATITLSTVTSDKPLSKSKDVKLKKTDRALVPLINKADGIYVASRTSLPTRLVAGSNLTDPVLVITPDPHLHVLSYIALQGRKPVLKLRTIYKGKVAEKGFVLPLSTSVDNYAISDFIKQEAL